MYFIEKVGIYGHGVFWIGIDREAGGKELVGLALGDLDSHHEWCLYKFQPQDAENTSDDADHELVKSIRKSDVCDHERLKMLGDRTICEDCRTRF